LATSRPSLDGESCSCRPRGLLDPLVVVLVLRMCPAGVWLAGAVMAADIAANWFVNRQDPSFLRQALGLLPITLFGLFVLASMVPLQRSLS
jgi:hypothetical protein